MPFAQRIREEVGIRTGAVGPISDPQYADDIITSGKANLVLLARELLREPYWAIKAQHTLEEEPGLADSLRLCREAPGEGEASALLSSNARDSGRMWLPHRTPLPVYWQGSSFRSRAFD